MFFLFFVALHLLTFPIGFHSVEIINQSKKISEYQTVFSGPPASQMVLGEATKSAIFIPKTTLKKAPSFTPPNVESPNSQDLGMIMDQINDYRKRNGLSALETDSFTCDFANSRASEISTNFSHDGFQQRIDNESFPYPSYSLVTENIAFTNNATDVASLWINSPEHAQNLRADTPYACVGISGDYYAFEGWKPK